MYCQWQCYSSYGKLLFPGAVFVTAPKQTLWNHNLYIKMGCMWHIEAQLRCFKSDRRLFKVLLISVGFTHKHIEIPELDHISALLQQSVWGFLLEEQRFLNGLLKFQLASLVIKFWIASETFFFLILKHPLIWFPTFYKHFTRIHLELKWLVSPQMGLSLNIKSTTKIQKVVST